MNKKQTRLAAVAGTTMALAIAGTAATPTNVDGYTPDAAALEQRTAARQRIIDKVCRPLIAAGGAEAASDD